MYSVIKNNIIPASFFLVFGFAVAVTPASADTIVDKVVANGNFSALEDAVVSQGLVDTLNSEGLTVFAPDNEAFENIPSFIMSVLEKNPDHLTDILTYHVVTDELNSSQVLSKKRIKTFGGENVRVNTIGGNAFINSSQITAVDNVASNGIIHEIDRVLIPNKIYKAAIENLRQEIKMLRDSIKEVRSERRAERNPHF